MLRGKKGRDARQRENLSPNRTSNSSDRLSDHLVGETGAKTMVMDKTTSGPGLLSYTYLLSGIQTSVSCQDPKDGHWGSGERVVRLVFTSSHVASCNTFPFSAFHCFLFNWSIENGWPSLLCSGCQGWMLTLRISVTPYMAKWFPSIKMILPYVFFNT